jgi:hypothetical protein
MKKNIIPFRSLIYSIVVLGLSGFKQPETQQEKATLQTSS